MPPASMCDSIATARSACGLPPMGNSFACRDSTVLRTIRGHASGSRHGLSGAFLPGDMDSDVSISPRLITSNVVRPLGVVAML